MCMPMSARSLCSLLCLIFITPAVHSQNSPAAPAPPPTSYSILTRDALTDHLKQFSGSNQDREQRIRNWFLQVGCSESQLIEQKVSWGEPPNLFCMLPGETNSIIVVSAHFDYVNRGEGVVDNWTGATLLPAFASTLRQISRRHTFVLISFTQEERGLVGSEYYVKHLTPEQRGRIAAVINLDTLGLAPTEVWVSHADPELVRILNGVAHLIKVPLSGVNVDGIGSTDAESFEPYKIPRITIHSVTQDTLRILHSPLDRFSAVHLDDYYSTYRLLTAYLVYLDGCLGRSAEPAHASPAASSATPQANAPQN
jgi:putative aminopeptidase FrvX